MSFLVDFPNVDMLKKIVQREEEDKKKEEDKKQQTLAKIQKIQADTLYFIEKRIKLALRRGENKISVQLRAMSTDSEDPGFASLAMYPSILTALTRAGYNIHTEDNVAAVFYDISW